MFFRGYYALPFFLPSARWKSWIPTKKLWNAAWKICVQKIPTIKISRFFAKMPFCFHREKHLLKDPNNFWCCYLGSASIAAHSSEKFNTRMLFTFISKLFPPSPPAKTCNLTSNYHFLLSWKSIYWKRQSTLDCTIKIVSLLMQNYVWNLTQAFS